MRVANFHPETHLFPSSFFIPLTPALSLKGRGCSRMETDTNALNEATLPPP